MPAVGRLAELNAIARQRQLTPHERIQRAALAGTGVRLSADEVAYLATDGAIIDRAENDSLGRSDDGIQACPSLGVSVS